MSISQFKIIIFLWNIEMLDSLTVIQICWNTGAQYCGIGGSSAVGNWSNISPLILFEPINGLRISAHCILNGATRAEQARRLATVTSYLSVSTTSALQLDPNTNLAIGRTVAAKIGYMKSILARGGGNTLLSYSIPTNPNNINYLTIASTNKNLRVNRLLHRLRQQTTNQEVIKNMFEQNKNHRFAQGLASNSTSFLTTNVSIISKTKLNTKAIIGWTTCTIGITGCLIIESLLLFQESKKRRVLKKYANSKEILIAND